MAQPVTFKFSLNHKAILSRIRRLPKLVNDAMDGQTKKDVINVIDEFKNGIKRNNFGLEALSELTIKSKELKGMEKPNAPLYGLGDSKKNSLINALAFRKIKNGYRLYRRRAKHHTANLPLNILLAIHEQGALIKTKNALIRIPPRPVVDKAITRALKKKKKNEPSRSVKKAINKLLKTGNENMFKKLSTVKEVKN